MEETQTIKMWLDDALEHLIYSTHTKRVEVAIALGDIMAVDQARHPIRLRVRARHHGSRSGAQLPLPLTPIPTQARCFRPERAAMSFGVVFRETRGALNDAADQAREPPLGWRSPAPPPLLTVVCGHGAARYFSLRPSQRGLATSGSLSSNGSAGFEPGVAALRHAVARALIMLTVGGASANQFGEAYRWRRREFHRFSRDRR